jgi:Flp pilus assembly protein TadG
MKRTKRTRGVSLVATGMWMVALLALVAAAIEVSRLTDTATEVQVSADAGALAAATAMTRGLAGQEVTIGQNAAANNFADGKAVPTSGVQIELGHYSSDPAANPHFTTTCTPGTDCNAAKATVTINNVKYILASILNGQASTGVQKNAVAAGLCQGSGHPFPLAVCNQALASPLSQDNLCLSGTLKSGLTMQSGANACWTYLSAPSQGTSTVQSLFPQVCGGSAPPDFSFVTFGQPLNFVGNPGVSAATWALLQCCIACQPNHQLTVPVIDCPEIATPGGANPCQGSQKTVMGFATLDISDVFLNGNTQCKNVYPGGSCLVSVNNVPPGQDKTMAANQVCKPDNSGKPGGASCTNFGNTAAPVLGQLP